MKHLQRLYKRFLDWLSRGSVYRVPVLALGACGVFIITWYLFLFVPLERLRLQREGCLSVDPQRVTQELQELDELHKALEQKMEKIDYAMMLMDLCDMYRISLTSYTNNEFEMITVRLTGPGVRLVEFMYELADRQGCAVYECTMMPSASLGALDVVLSLSFNAPKNMDAPSAHLDFPASDPFDPYRVIQGERE